MIIIISIHHYIITIIIIIQDKTLGRPTQDPRRRALRATPDSHRGLDAASVWNAAGAEPALDVCMYIHIHVYIYIYIEREREREI